jgi:hypothetical protein
VPNWIAIIDVLSLGRFISSLVMTLNPQQPSRSNAPLSIVKPNSHALEILRAFEGATPGMRNLGQLESTGLEIEDLLLEEAVADHDALYEGFPVKILKEAKYLIQGSRIVTDEKLAASHNLEVALLIDIQTRDGKHLYSPDTGRGLGTALHFPVFHIYGRALDNSTFSSPALSTPAYLELLALVANRVDARKSIPARIAGAIREALEIEFRGHLLTPEERDSDTLFPNSLTLNHSDPKNLRWTIGTTEGELVLRPDQDIFKDFVLRRIA